MSKGNETASWIAYDKELGPVDVRHHHGRDGILPADLRGDGPCADCGTDDNIVWFTDGAFWNRVMESTNPPGQGNGGIVCVPCFVKRTDDAGLWPTGWRLVPEFHWETGPERVRRQDGGNVSR